MAGSVRERGKGRWQVRVFAGVDPVSGRDRYVSRTVNAGSKREAEKHAALLVAEVAGGKHNGTSGMTFGGLLERWLAFKRASNLSPTTLSMYAAVIRNDLLPNLGSIKLDKLSAFHLDFLYARVAERAGPPMAGKVHSVVRGALGQAKRWGLVATNVATDASPPKPTKHVIQPPTTDELRLILAEAKGDFRPLLHLAATSGARRGELLALRWCDINLDARRVTIRNNVVEASGTVIVKPTKTGTVREVVLDYDTVAALRDHRTRCVESALACGAQLPEDAFVFSPRPGNSEPYIPRVVTRRFGRLCQRVGIERVHLHGLRHFVATQLVADGFDIQSVSTRLGHTRASMTLGTYTHPTGTNDQRAADAIGAIVSQAQVDPNEAAANKLGGG